jgi:hypothetical protein
MLNLRLTPERLREEARYLRYLMDELDYVRWRVQTSWSRLGPSELNFLAAAGVADLGYGELVTSLRRRADALCRYAWHLEATAARIEEADERAAADFYALLDVEPG